MGRRFAQGTGAVKSQAEPSYKSPFEASDLNPKDRPGAISHNVKHFDALHGMLENIRSNVLDAPLSDREQKNKDYVRVLSTVRGHVAEASKHLGNAYAAHATGGIADEALRHGHTAVESYRNAATHVADALSFMKGEAGFGPRLSRDVKTPEFDTDRETGKTTAKFPVKTTETGGLKFERAGLSNLGKKLLSAIPTHQDVNNAVNSYQSHVRTSLEGKGISVPKGVADTPANFSETSEPSTLSKQTLGRKGYPLNYEEELSKNAVSKRGSEMKAKVRQKELYEKRGIPIAVGQDGKLAKRIQESPYAGVGITGFHDLQKSVANHWDKNFSHLGPFVGSVAHQNPEEYAKKHNVSLPDEKKTVSTALSRMGSATKGVTSGSLAAEAETQPGIVPKLTKSETSTMGEADAPNPSATGNVLGKRSRSTDFAPYVQGGKG